MKKELKKLFRGIKLIATDFDGVWTDGRVWVDQNGVESVVCSRKDTLRIPEIKALGIEIFVISKEKNLVVAMRCKKMGVDYRHGANNKAELLTDLLEDRAFTMNQVAYVGDDLNDLECLYSVGFPITVNDADPACKMVAKHTTSRDGGDHAMREIFDLIIEAQREE